MSNLQRIPVLNPEIKPYYERIRLEAVDFEPTLGQRIYVIWKRLFDILISSLALILLSPILLGIATAIRLDSKGPVIFRQPRVGQNGDLFTIYKFRTMRVDAPKSMSTADFKDDSQQYITRVGRFLRKNQSG